MLIIIKRFDIYKGYLLQVEAYTCYIGRDRDGSNEWRRLLSYLNQCECTEVAIGGLNTWTPVRPLVPIYAKTPLFSEDVNSIREHYNIYCDKTSKFLLKECLLSLPILYTILSSLFVKYSS